jgi:hypothetical protein
MRFRSKTAIVTAGSSGIGLACARNGSDLLLIAAVSFHSPDLHRLGLALCRLCLILKSAPIEPFLPFPITKELHLTQAC